MPYWTGLNSLTGEPRQERLSHLHLSQQQQQHVRQGTRQGTTVTRINNGIPMPKLAFVLQRKLAKQCKDTKGQKSSTATHDASKKNVATRHKNRRTSSLLIDRISDLLHAHLRRSHLLGPSFP
mmetsp:Transcript_80288/g.125094  ORF Transcript_80288/g.125094 Transcript_80288/m.125094 type:complete len:123 (-) Transcript_80288:226-594(-)